MRLTGSLVALFTLVVPAAAQDRDSARGAIQGVVTDFTGAVIVTATVKLFSAEGIRTAQTNALGQFQFAGLPSGRYTLEVSALGFKRHEQHDLEVTDRPQGPLTIVLSVAEAGRCNGFSEATYLQNGTGNLRVIGTVTGPTARRVPVIGARLSLFKRGSVSALAKVFADTKGAFDFGELPPAQYYLVVSSDGFNEARTRVFWVTKSTTAQFDFTLLRKGDVVICM